MSITVNEITCLIAVCVQALHLTGTARAALAFVRTLALVRTLAFARTL